MSEFSVRRRQSSRLGSKSRHNSLFAPSLLPAPTPNPSSSDLFMAAYLSDPSEVDAWIAQLGQCKPLTEADVKKLCDKVSLPPFSSPYRDRTEIYGVPSGKTLKTTRTLASFSSGLSLLINVPWCLPYTLRRARFCKKNQTSNLYDAPSPSAATYMDNS